MPTTSTPNMGLTLPVVQVEPGPQFATDINSCLTSVDQHTHAPGSGVPINSNGISLLNDLPFNGVNAISVRSARFSGTAGSSTTDAGCIYRNSNDLWYNDMNGNKVRLTLNGFPATSGTNFGATNSSAIFNTISTSALLFSRAATLSTLQLDSLSNLKSNTNVLIDPGQGTDSYLRIASCGPSVSSRIHLQSTDDSNNCELTYASVGGIFALAGSVANSETFQTSNLASAPVSFVMGGSSGVSYQLATNATNGFLYIRNVGGAPNGTPAPYTGRSAISFDPATNKLWIYNATSGIWISK